MAEARGRDAWAHTSTLLAMIANVNRDPKKGRAFKPADFDPHAQGGRSDVIEIDRGNVGLMREAFCQNGQSSQS